MSYTERIISLSPLGGFGSPLDHTLPIDNKDLVGLSVSRNDRDGTPLDAFVSVYVTSISDEGRPVITFLTSGWIGTGVHVGWTGRIPNQADIAIKIDFTVVGASAVRARLGVITDD
jgi:hypothetical protein